MKQSIKIDGELINYLRISYECPSCRKQVILTPDFTDKEYLTCGACKYSIHIRSNQVRYLKDIMFNFDRERKYLEFDGIHLWIEGQPELSKLQPATTTSRPTPPAK